MGDWMRTDTLNSGYDFGTEVEFLPGWAKDEQIYNDESAWSTVRGFSFAKLFSFLQFKNWD